MILKDLEDIKIAVLIPCRNEALTIAKVVQDFQQVLPGKNTTVYVYDNDSTDDTFTVASRTSAIVRKESIRGKGNVVRRMFRDVEAELYVLVDGDDTYDAKAVIEMLLLSMTGPYDLINYIRRSNHGEAYRRGHLLGNQGLTALVRYIFGDRIPDMLSGYKVFSRRFVKSFPALSKKFDIETELAIHALELSMPVSSVIGDYGSRPEGSASKLHTLRDGIHILRLIISLFKHERPLQFFALIGLFFACISLFLGIPIIIQFFKIGLVPRLPTAVLAMGIMLLAFLSIMTGIILDTVTRGRLEVRMLSYLQYQHISSQL